MDHFQVLYCQTIVGNFRAIQLECTGSLLASLRRLHMFCTETFRWRLSDFPSLPCMTLTLACQASLRGIVDVEGRCRSKSYCRCEVDVEFLN
jgi:hypothetical protein